METTGVTDVEWLDKTVCALSDQLAICTAERDRYKAAIEDAIRRGIDGWTLARLAEALTPTDTKGE